MSIFDIRPDDIRYADLERLVRVRERESRRLEFKSALHLQVPKQKEEAGKDIAAMANGGGGILIYGIAEEMDDGVKVAKELSPLPADISEDLDQVLSSRISPRVEYQLGWVADPNASGGFLVVRVLPNALRLHCSSSML